MKVRAFGLTAIAASVLVILGATAAAPVARAAAQLSLDWSMPDRYGDANGDGLADQVYPPDGTAVVDPGGWRVDLSVSGADCGEATQRTWWIEGLEIAAGDPRLLSATPSGCSLSYRFPAEGVYEVAFEERDGQGKLLGSVKRAVTVQDFLIVSIGDSVASGEGNPETNAPATSWENGADGAAQCHRSRYAGPSQAALALEKADPHTSVTFVHLACSGATILQGLLAPELSGQGPVEVAQPAQLAELPAIVGKREIDALTLSIGANDVHFSQLVESCLKKSDCNLATPGSAATQFQHSLLGLPGSYDQLAPVLAGAGVPSDRVYHTQYYDPTHDDSGLICADSILADTPLRHVPGRFTITADEATWASETMIVGLNNAVVAADVTHGWQPVGDIVADFFDHGYCAAGRWVDTYTESQANQGDDNGTLHPNHPGQADYGRRLAAGMTSDLYPGGGTTPRRPFQRLILQGQGPTEPSFSDVVANVQPAATVRLRVRIDGEDRAARDVTYALQGPGTLSATSGTTDSAGQATLTYQSPAAPTGCSDGPVCAVVTASFTDADGVHTDALSIGVTRISVTVNPSSLTLAPGQSATFGAAVTGTADQGVAWTATGGTIDRNTGAYTAGTTPGVYSVTATSQADASVHGSASVTITPPADSGVEWLSHFGFAEALTSLACSPVLQASTLANPYTADLSCPGTGVDGLPASTEGHASGSFTVTDFAGADQTARPVRDLGQVHATGAASGSGSNATGFGVSDYSIEFVVNAPAMMTIRTAVADAFVEFLCGTFRPAQADIYNLTSLSSGGILRRDDLGEATLPLPAGASCSLHARVEARGGVGPGSGSFDVTASFAAGP